MLKYSIILCVFFLVQGCSTVKNSKRERYFTFRVDLKLEDNLLGTNKIECFTIESNYRDTLMLKKSNDSIINLVHFFKIGKKKELQNINSVNIQLKLMAENGDVLESVNGEILKQDWICK
jgi:hypothetical protein